MNRKTLLTPMLAGCVVAVMLATTSVSEAGLTTEPFSGADGFNLITKGNADLNGVDVHEGAIVGGDLTMTNEPQFGSDFTAADSNRAGVVAYGNVTKSNSNPINAKGKYWLPNKPSGLGVTNSNGSFSSDPMGGNFDSVYHSFETRSSALGGQSTNASYSETNGGKTLTLTATAGQLNVFNFDHSFFSSFLKDGNEEIQVVLPDTLTKVVINYSGDWDFANHFNFIGSTSSHSDQILWNFLNATNVKFADNQAFEGSILAPDADVSLNGSFVDGQVVSNTFSGKGGLELHNQMFWTVSPVPEPAEAGLIGAVALIGLGIWRLRRRERNVAEA